MYISMKNRVRRPGHSFGRAERWKTLRRAELGQCVIGLAVTGYYFGGSEAGATLVQLYVSFLQHYAAFGTGAAATDGVDSWSPLPLVLRSRGRRARSRTWEMCISSPGDDASCAGLILVRFWQGRRLGRRTVDRFVIRLLLALSQCEVPMLIDSVLLWAMHIGYSPTNAQIYAKLLGESGISQVEWGELAIRVGCFPIG